MGDVTIDARRALIAAALLVICGVGIGLALHHSSPSGRAAPAPIGSHGFDVSWPQCAGADAGRMPPGRPAYMILGLTHGAGDTVNPCLASQLDWAKSRGVRVGAYLVPSFPTTLQRAGAGDGLFGTCGTSARCRLRNDGAAQAQAAVATMHAAGLQPPRLWIDVELGNAAPWSHHTAANRALLRGVVAGLRAAHLPIGIYTTSQMWNAITGDWQLHAPNWLPSGDGKARHATALCDTTATGGATWLVQYTRSLDSDLTCPVLAPVAGQHGALWQFRNTTQRLLSHGAAVQALQRVVGTPPNGSYDAATTIAVSKWQTTHHLPVTGQVTPTDWRAMGAYRTHGGHGFLLSRFVSSTS